MLVLLDFTSLHHHQGIHFAFRVLTLLLQKVLFFVVAVFKLLSDQKFAFIILFFGFLPIRDKLLLGASLFLLVNFYLLFLGHEDLETLLFNFFLGSDTLLHFFNIGSLFDLL